MNERILFIARNDGGIAAQTLADMLTNMGLDVRVGATLQEMLDQKDLGNFPVYLCYGSQGWGNVKDFYEAGIPTIFGEQQASESEATSILKNSGMYSQIGSDVVINSGRTLEFVEDGGVDYKKVFKESSFGPDNPIQFPAEDYVYGIWSGLAANPSTKVVGVEKEQTGYALITYSEKGSQNQKYAKTPATLIHAGFFYGGVSSRFAALLFDLFNLALDDYKVRTIGGFVVDKDDNPAQATLHIHSQVDGKVEGITRTNAQGEYTVNIANLGEIYVVCIPDSTEKTLKVAGRIQPDTGFIP